MTTPPPAPPTTPPVPAVNAALATHPSSVVRARFGWKPNMASSRTGNPWADFLLNIGQNTLMPPAKAAPFQPGPVSPGMARHYGNEFYASVAGRTAIAEQLAQQRSQQMGLLGILQNGAPSLQPYVDATRQSMQDPQFRGALGGLAPLL